MAATPAEIVMEVKAAVEDLKSKSGDVEALKDRIVELEQKLAEGVPRSNRAQARESFGRIVAAEFAKHRATFKSAGRVAFDVQAAVTTGEVGRQESEPLTGTPSLGDLWLPTLLQTRASPIDTTHYTRITGHTGSAGVQQEQSEKAETQLTYVKVSQKAITIAGWTEATEQALQTEAGLMGSVDTHLRREILKAADSVLLTGDTATGGTEFEGLIDLAPAFSGSFSELGDLAVEAMLHMAINGFRANTVVFHPNDFAKIILARDNEDRYQNPNAWAGTDWPMVYGGMRVALSPNMAQGSALVLDSQFNEFQFNSLIAIAIGYVNNQFKTNEVTIRGETLATPVVRDTRSLYLVSAGSP